MFDVGCSIYKNVLKDFEAELIADIFIMLMKLSSNIDFSSSFWNCATFQSYLVIYNANTISFPIPLELYHWIITEKVCHHNVN